METGNTKPKYPINIKVKNNGKLCKSDDNKNWITYQCGNYSINIISTDIICKFCETLLQDEKIFSERLKLSEEI